MNKTSASSILRLVFSVLLIISLAGLNHGCGEKSESAKIDFKPEENPLAINADLTIGSGDDETTIEAPWYLFRYSIKNGSSDQTLYLVTFKFTVSGTKNGVTTSKTYSIDPGEFCADDYARPFLGIVTPGLTFTGNKIDSSTDPFSRCANPSDPPPANVPDPLTTGFEGWYISGLPESDTLIYTIQIEGEGWFENSDGNITERAYIYGFQVTR